MILKAITVSDGHSTRPSIIDWMPSLPMERPWNNYSKNFHNRTVAAGSELTLLELTEAEGELDFAACRDSVRMALGQLTVNVEYTDIYGATMRPVRKELSWFSQ